MNENIVAIIFRLLNFVGLFALFFYLFKKYALQMIIIQIGQKESILRNLFNRQQALEQEQYLLDERVTKEAQLCASLKEKVVRWRKLVDQKLAERDQERTDRIKLLSQVAHQHAENHAMNQVKKGVLSTIATQAQGVLSKRFADTKEGQEFIKPIIDFMHKSTS